ncbi:MULTISPECIES: hypothetical protein [unclassified Mesorhizobium]|uniref:hypothetical protein n=1 Tax=unclassified Mesorhizobium TaxID=325217 RepID=UPI002415ECFB|nr:MULTISPECIES: hypothetical protein [unclassified Mesorhizobium]MDG4902774.1 hypothetical protein [Mesorhizobium sp. WSM4962]MDG4920783.1 hypothetical protein [Mesorhizobium sp. WSM4989]
MSRDFAPISPALWTSPGFLSLNGDGRQLHLYFISSPHQTSAGCCRIREGYALADLGWISQQYREALANVIGADLVRHDPRTEETYVKKWFKHKGNIPTNKDHAKGTMKIISNIDSDQIRELAEADFLATEWGRKTFPAPDTDNSGNHPFDSDRVVQPITSALANSRLMRAGR